MDKYRKAFGVPEQERTQLAKEIWRIALDEMWIIPVVANSPASQGVRVIKNNMGNIPERLWNSAVSDNPAHRPHGDLVLQVLIRTVTAAAGRSGSRTRTNPSASTHQPRPPGPGPACLASSPCPSTATEAGPSSRSLRR